MKRSSIFLIIVFTLIPISYYLTIRSRINYIIDYNVDLPNREEIIYKTENFNYAAYLIPCYDDYPHSGITCYVDSNLLHLLKSRIEKDIGFKWWFKPFYEHTLRYYFLAENHSRLYLTYNDNTIFSIKDPNNQSLFLPESIIFSTSYLNFARIPYVYGDQSTVMVSNFIFVEINLEYVWVCGYICYHSHSYNQYLVLGENLEVVLIFINYDVFID
ncbi:MAG: hypothetical protein ACFFE4_05760 [Candidatus Thorarchaeota archaeon]